MAEAIFVHRIILGNYIVGDNSDSAIAPGQSASSGFLTELNPIILGVGVTVSSFDTGQKHNCVIRNDGKIMCWGTGTNGQLGNGYSVTDSTPSLVASPAWATYTKLAQVIHIHAQCLMIMVLCAGVIIQVNLVMVQPQTV